MKRIYALFLLLISMFALIGCTISVTPTNQTFTLTELAQYDGLNGAKAYVAINGIVYDVTNEDEWSNGSHQGMHLAGTDATAIFAQSPHSQALIDSLKQIGTIVTESTQSTSSSAGLPVFTLAQLSSYTGTNGSTAYIAVNGIVYDVTNEFTNGAHKGLQLGGTDASVAFANSPHATSWLNQLTIVGTLATSTVENPSNPTTTEYLPVFTLEDLSSYTGANGTTAYIAVSGVVYDVTSEFTNGAHKGLQLGGTDATVAFANSPHATSWLNQLQKVGSLEGAPLIVKSTTTPTTPNTNDDDDDEHDDDDVSISDLPQSVVDYLSANYPGISIDEIELEDGMIEVELVNDTEIYFTSSGQWIRTEFDD